MTAFRNLILLCITLTLTKEAEVKGPRLMNGETAAEGQFPWQVAVVNAQPGLLSYCGGALISEEWVLTAAHCVYDADNVTIYYGSLTLDDSASRVISDGWDIHQDFDSTTLKNDIAVVHLPNPLIFNDNIKSIDLSEEELEAGVPVTVSGWGAPGAANTDFDVLKYITVTTIDNEECVEVYGSDIVLPSVVCTKSGNPVQNPCEGDGGDPVVVIHNLTPVHVAIFSFLSSFGCDNGDYPAGYTRTAYYREWIREAAGI